jgi:hypothetical protein
MRSSGRAATQRRACHEAVIQNPGLTAAEIAVVLRGERHMPSRRLPELREGGLVENGPPRICTVMKRSSITWYPAAAVPPDALPTENQTGTQP